MKKICFALICLLMAPKAFFAAEEQTFTMIKPTAVKEHHVGQIIQEIEKNGFTIVAIKMVQLTEERAKAFYHEHEGKPFFADLVAKMSSGPVVALALKGDNAIKHLREVVGATNPEKAAPGTIRALYGKNVTENAIHASDSASSAEREIAFFFANDDLCQPK